MALERDRAASLPKLVCDVTELALDLARAFAALLDFAFAFASFAFPGDVAAMSLSESCRSSAVCMTFKNAAPSARALAFEARLASFAAAAAAFSCTFKFSL